MAGLRAAYGADASAPPAPYRRDGLLLLHRGATYVPGRSPLALSWRDAACSAWSVDVDVGNDDEGAPDVAADVAAAGAQRVLLRLLAAPPGALGTGDEPPAVLATVPDWGGDPPAGALLRCELPAGGLHLDAEGRLAGAQLRVLGLAAGRRAEADTANRVRPAVYYGTGMRAASHILALTRYHMAFPARRSWRSTPRVTRRCALRRYGKRLRPRLPTTRGAAPPTPRRLTWTRREVDAAAEGVEARRARRLGRDGTLMPILKSCAIGSSGHVRLFVVFPRPEARDTPRPGCAPLRRGKLTAVG